MRGEAPPDIDTLRNLEMFPDAKRLVLVALGARFPSKRDDYYALARVMNYAPWFPHRELEAAMAP